ncbi:hypothetical protein BJ508DRAFT_91787 [Ascobolus immersus RN42]|uniref:Extracellular membrane protein CFEM domain-containing protein n=1 Tax=Ascobolus immersus RN42 TaxID=1160509 RepID=A0A3N4HEZ5_ASCIM|nr:hypothetical protein BJ508DRAFT_91787 [Ascobolus immersus RN42]
MLRHGILTTAIYLLPLLTSGVDATLPNGFNTSISNWFFIGELPGSLNLSSGCVKAYSTSIDCDSTLLMSPNIPSKPTTLDKLCTQRCETSLLKYQRDVVAACEKEDLVGKGLERTWLGSLVNSTASIPLYFRQCLRDIETKTLCELTALDYELAWDAASSDGASRQTIQAFCADTCLTQNVILNAPTEANLEDLNRMCGSTLGIERFPFVENMVDAGILSEDQPILTMKDSKESSTVGGEAPSATTSAGMMGSDSAAVRIGGMEWTAVATALLVMSLGW